MDCTIPSFSVCNIEKLGMGLRRGMILHTVLEGPCTKMFNVKTSPLQSY